MTQEGSEASVASSSAAPPNWWELHAAATALSSWGGSGGIGHGRRMMWPPPPAVHPQPQQNHPSNSSGEEDLSISTSFTNATSNHSGLSVDSSSADLPPPAGNEPVENMWNQVLYNVGNSGGLQSQAEDAENFLEAMAYRRNVATDQTMFDPACDYLKKMDGSWDYANQNNHFKQLSNYNNGSSCSMIGSAHDQRLANNLSDFVSSWSIAPPNAQLDHNLAPSVCNISMNPSLAQYSASNITHIKHEAAEERRTNAYNLPLFENQNQTPPLLRPAAGITYNGYFSGLNSSSFGGLSSRLCADMGELPLSGTRSLSDLISFGGSGCLQKPAAVEARTTAKPHVIKGLDSSENKKQGYEVTSSARGKGRSASSGTAEGKKKRFEDSSETLFKKPKNETSTVSSLKSTQPPKIKMQEKITALQQLVSPFGKTDTASVLLETINVIRILQEQVQLLSDPYMKSSSGKDHNNSWGDIERKLEKADHNQAKVDLRSKGLCLVPVSCIPQSHRENSGPDYWMQPTYRSCLYR